jgi:molybdate transport system substrate-binding protein
MRTQIVTVALVSVLLLSGCGQSSSVAQKQRLRVLCGSSMAEPAQVAGKSFTQLQPGVNVEYDFGGSETLLPKVLAGAEADIYICHDPFEQKVRDGGKWASSAIVGYLEPVIVVRPGNPKGIHALEDLAKPEIRLGIGDPRYSTCGEILIKILTEKGLKDKVMPQVAVQLRSHVELANGLIAGPLDAAVIWNFAAKLYQDKLEVVSAGVQWPPVRVTILGLAQSPNPALRDSFIKLCQGEAVQEIFSKYGYARSGSKP